MVDAAIQSNQSRPDLLPDHNEHDRYSIPPLNVELGVWQGEYLRQEQPWLRWWDSEGQLLPSSEERAEQANQRAERESERAERLAEKLRSLGMDPDEV